MAMSLEINNGKMSVAMEAFLLTSSDEVVNSLRRMKSGEIFEVRLKTKSNTSTCISIYDKCIERYRWRQAAESRIENTSRHVAHCHTETTVVRRYYYLPVWLITRIIMIAERAREIIFLQ